MAMLESKRAVIILPKQAFHKPSMARKYEVKVGGNGRTLHDFFLDTKAEFTSIEPHASRYPRKYFFPDYVITMKDDRVEKIELRVED